MYQFKQREEMHPSFAFLLFPDSSALDDALTLVSATYCTLSIDSKLKLVWKHPGENE
jgi:hypothetical protein